MDGQWTAQAMYGTLPSPQPTPTGVATHAPGTPEPTGRTEPRPAAKGPLGNPIFVLVGMVALAILITQVTVRGTLELEG